ncbi:MAG: hypothetical protein WA138_15075 [Parvibaculum sp.]
MTDFNIPGVVKAPRKPDPLVTQLVDNGFEKDVADLLVESFRSRETNAGKMKASQDRLLINIKNKVWLARIEDCLRAFSWTEAELKKIGWYDDAGDLTVFGRICMFAVRGNITISDRNRQLKAKKVDKHTPSFPGFGSPSFDNNIDLEGLMENSDPEEAPFYTYEDPAEDRRAFLKQMSAQRGVEVREDDRFKPTQTSARPCHEHLTLTKEAADYYHKLAGRLDSSYRRELGLTSDLHEPIDLVDFSAWFIMRSKLAGWSKPTVVKYRLALTHWIQTVYSELDLDDCPLLNANLYQALDAAEPDLSTQDRGERMPSKDGKTKRGPALKKRYFERDDMLSVISYLQQISKDAYCDILENWLIAAVSTGLRPGEWRLTSIVEGEKPMTQEPYIILYVMNRKSINGRCSDVLRTLDITNMSPRILNAIRYMSDAGFNAYQKGDAVYAAMQKRCSGLLTRACRIALGRKGKKYSLFNCRHQFIANAKGMRRTPEEISCMLGCHDVMILMEHYGRMVSAWDRRYLLSFPKPVEVELKRMLRYADAMAKHQVRYAGIVNGRTVGITPEMRAEADF